MDYGTIFFTLLQTMKYIFLALFFFLLLSPTPLVAQSQGELMEAVVKNIERNNTTTVQIKNGSLAGREYVVSSAVKTVSDISYKKGDNVVISLNHSPTGDTVYITDFVRRPSLFILVALFVFLIILVARWQGLSSLLGMFFSFLIIGQLIIPNILLGNDPLLISLFGAFFIIPVTFYLSHGLHKKTTVAIGGTFVCLLLIALLSLLFVEAAKLTGFASEEALYVEIIKGTALNLKSILLAGFIVGAMAVLNDITISQASIVQELYRTNPRLKMREAYTTAMAVGRDHVASLVNTLVLVYAGASLPLFLLFYNSHLSYAQVINQEVIATEIVRTLVSSSGIVVAVPVTTAIACYFLRKNA